MSITFKVIGTDHFDWAPEEYRAGEFATRADAKRRKQIEKTSMNTTVIEEVESICKTS